MTILMYIEFLYYVSTKYYSAKQLRKCFQHLNKTALIYKTIDIRKFVFYQNKINKNNFRIYSDKFFINFKSYIILIVIGEDQFIISLL